MADRAVDAIGVNTHINYLGTIYDTGYSSIIKPRLLELGVRHIRDNPGGDRDAKTKARFTELASSGIRLLLTTSSTTSFNIDYVKSLNVGGVQVVEGVEPPNERDNAWGSGMPAQMRSYMMGLYPKYKSDATTRNMPVLGPSFANTRDSANKLRAAFPDAANYMDIGNIHSYSGRDPEGTGGGGWAITLSDAINRQRMGSTKAVWATEKGYKMSGSRNGHSAVTQRAAAKYLPRQVLSHLMRGAPRLYVYQLLNHNSEDFGLLNSNGSPRLQFTALKNAIGLLKDRGGSFTAGTLKYTLSGNLTSIQQILFQKRDGRFYLVLWQGVLSSNIASSDSGIGDIEPARRQCTLAFSMPITTMRLYEPSFSSNPIKTLVNLAGISSIPLLVPDHLLVVELVPASCD
jgi:hypothetical protein